MSNCSTCFYMTEPSEGTHCSKCTHNYVDWYKPMTNGQKLRLMSDRELAKLLSTDCGICGHACENTANCGKECAKKIETWLQAPVENQR